MKYKQVIIPEVSTDKLKGLSKQELRKFVLDYYKKHYQNEKTIVNKSIGISVEFIGIGRKKTSYGGYMYIKKASVIKVLDKLIKYAEYNNWGERKKKDKKEVIGYLNFKSKVKIDGENEFFRINIQVRNDGKFHYSLELNRLKK